MTLELVATMVAGVVGAGVGIILRSWLKDRAPRWIGPAMAGAAMIAMSIWQEYSWLPRLKDGMPPGVVIAEVAESTSPMRPWTYLVPLVSQAWVVDTRRTLINPNNPDVLIAHVLRYGRWKDTTDALVAFDCAAPARVDITEEIRFDDSGKMLGGTWVPLATEDKILRAACDGG